MIRLQPIDIVYGQMQNSGLQIVNVFDLGNLATERDTVNYYDCDGNKITGGIWQETYQIAKHNIPPWFTTLQKQ